MSQEKVDKYKEQKANRKELLAKEKRHKKLVKTAWIAGFILVIAGIGTAIGIEAHMWYVNKYLPSKPNYTSESLVISDLAGVLDDGDDETAAEDETKADDATEADTEAASADETEAESASAEE